MLALSLLCLEWTRISGSPGLRRAGLIFPVAAVLMAIPTGGLSDNSLYVGFLDQLTDHVASPVWITTWLSLLIAVYAVLRRIRQSEVALSVLLILLAFLSSDSLRPNWTADPATWPLALAAIIQFSAGCQRRNPIQAFAGQLCGLFIARNLLSDHFGLMGDVLAAYLLVLGMILTGRLLQGAFSTFLGVTGTVFLTAACFLAPLTLTPAIQHQIPEATQTVVAIAMLLFTATSIGLWFLTRDQLLKWSARLNIGVTVSASLVKAALLLMRLPGGRGIMWALGGILWFALAAWISSRKARTKVVFNSPADGTQS